MLCFENIKTVNTENEKFRGDEKKPNLDSDLAAQLRSENNVLGFGEKKFHFVDLCYCLFG